MKQEHQGGIEWDADVPDDRDEQQVSDLLMDAPWQRRLGAPFHPWFGRRPEDHALAAAAFALAGPTIDRDRLSAAVREMDYAETKRLLEAAEVNRAAAPTVVDLCSGVGTLAASAAAIGCEVTSVELQPIPVAISRLANDIGVDRNLVPERGSDWRGLDAEVREASDFVLNRILLACRRQQVTRTDRLWARVDTCPTCGLEVPLVRRWRYARDHSFALLVDKTMTPRVQISPSETELDRPGTYRLHEVACPRCRAQWSVRAPDVLRARVLLQRTVGGGYEAVDGVSAQLAPLSPLWASTADRVDAEATTWAWCRAPYGVINDGAALLPSHRVFLEAGHEAVARLREALLGRPGLPERGEGAVVLACSLLFTAGAVESSVLAEWDHGQVRAALPRGSMFPPPPMFGERGTQTIERRWKGRLQILLESWRRSRDRGSSRVRVLQGDAAATGLADGCADAVLWDPAVYDNIDYGAVARPYEHTFPRNVGVGPDSPEALTFPSLPAAERINAPLDREAADLGLAGQAAEARRLVRPAGKVAVYWHARDRHELQRFLDLVAPVGLTLNRAVRVRHAQERNYPDKYPEGGTYLLLFEPVGEAAAGTRSVADATRVLTLADENKPSLYEALAQILDQVWEDADLASHVPKGFRGTRLQRLSELVASTPNPADLLIELGRRPLREELARHGAEVPEGADARSLSELLLSQLGFTVPSATGFSVNTALNGAYLALANIPLSRAREEAVGQFTAIVAAVEDILRFSVVSWALDAAHRRLDPAAAVGWAHLVASALHKDDDRRFDILRLSLGDWGLAFREVPKRLAADPYRASPYVAIVAGQKRARLVDRADTFTRLRNAVMHNKPEIAVLDHLQLADHLVSEAKPLLQVLTRLVEEGHLPRSVRPVEEVRDAWGRRRLVLADPQGVRLEVFVQAETDLNQPLVYLSSGSNPRDVAPTLLPAQDIARAMDQSTGGT